MAIRINNNQVALGLNRNLNKFTDRLQENFRALSSGSRFTKPSVDPSAMQLAEKLSSEIRNSGQAARNISDAVSFLNIADGALESAGHITARLEELATQASNGTLSDSQRIALNNEYQALMGELDRISSQTRFNDTQVFGSTTTIQSGTDGSASSRLTVTLPSLSSSSQGTDISTQSGAQATMDLLKDARSTISAARSEVGANESRLQTAFENLQTQRMNNIEARSRIADTDFAAEAAKLAANKILQSTNTSLASINNNNLTNVLKLLRA